MCQVPIDARSREDKRRYEWRLLESYVRSLLSKHEANPAPGACNDGQVCLSSVSWKSKWQTCADSFRENQEFRRAHGTGEPPGSFSMFKRVWRREKRLKDKRAKSHSKCDTCAKIDRQYAELMGRQDAASVAFRKFLTRARMEHDEKHLARRRVLDDAGFISYIQPRRTWTIVIDAATRNNFLLPRFQGRRPKELCGKPFWGFKLTAAFCYGFGFLPFLVHDSQTAGPNLVWTVCWLALSRLRDHYGFWPEELHLTLDNTTGENKTQFMLSFCSWLVKSGKVKRVRLVFLMVGHTHIIIDQIFGSITIGLRREELLTPVALMRNIDQTMAGLPQYSATPTIWLKSIWDFKDWTDSMGLDHSISRLFKGDITDGEGPYQGMYDFMFYMAGTDVRMQYREEIDHPWLPHTQGCLTIATLPSSPPKLQEISPWSKWGMESNTSLHHTLSVCLSLFGSDRSKSSFNHDIFDMWKDIIASVPTVISMLPAEDKLVFAHFDNSEIPRLQGPREDGATTVPQQFQDAGTGAQHGGTVPTYDEWLASSGICIRKGPLAIDPVISSEQSKAEFDRKRAAMERLIFVSDIPCLTQAAPVWSGCKVLATGTRGGGVSLYQVLSIGRLQSPHTPGVVAYAIRYEHDPDPKVSGMFGTFRRTTSGDTTDQASLSRRHLTRKDIVVFNAQLMTTKKSKERKSILNLETLRCLSKALPEFYTFPKPEDLPDAHVELEPDPPPVPGGAPRARRATASSGFARARARRPPAGGCGFSSFLRAKGRMAGGAGWAGRGFERGAARRRVSPPRARQRPRRGELAPRLLACLATCSQQRDSQHLFETRDGGGGSAADRCTRPRTRRAVRPGVLPRIAPMAEYAPKVTCVAKVHERVSASLLWSAWTASKMDTKDLVCSHADPDSTGCMRAHLPSASFDSGLRRPRASQSFRWAMTHLGGWFVPAEKMGTQLASD